jgi:hypothetical protein
MKKFRGVRPAKAVRGDSRAGQDERMTRGLVAVVLALGRRRAGSLHGQLYDVFNSRY